MTRGRNHLTHAHAQVWHDRSRSAFTLVELLVVIAIILLLMSILLPSMSEARVQAQRVVCLSNLKQFGTMAHTAAGDDSKQRLHLAHEATNEDSDRGPYFWMGSGDHCWGGADGTDPEFGGPNLGLPPKGAKGRFMNRYMTGGHSSNPQAQRDFRLFQCPTDKGMVADVFSAAPRSSAWSENVFKASGNSYMGDYYYVKLHGLFDDPSDHSPYRRWGAYRRPLHQFSEPSKNLLFWESRFIQAMANTAELGSANIGFDIGSRPQTIPGWHGGRSWFNAVFADGHAAVIQLRKSGDMNDPRDYATPGNAYWRTYWRGKGWQYDNFPQPTVKNTWFSPAVGPERWLTGIWNP
ncbi:MAG: prepilin-type N-terminal cleavage/methylation domain-containing protein [Planctomycetia bacterium]|nr:MAG: prepilin-type N-terminal cleavage/methylation domain-containing protein [Planctomycetia bacterium]